MRFSWGLLFGSVLAVGSVKAQSFERGYLVTTAGDTLRGEIQNRFWQAPPESMVFRSSPAAPEKEYSRRLLRAVRLESGRYFRAEVLVVDHGARTHTGDLPSRLVVSSRTDSLLAEVLVDGPVPLLRAVVDAGMSHYFVRRPGRPYLELTERKYLFESEGHQRIVNANNYRSQLAVYFADCPAAVGMAGKAPFSAQGLAAVVKAFGDHCMPEGPLRVDAPAPDRPVRLLAFNGGTLLGMSFNKLQTGRSNFIGEEAPLLDNLNLDGQLHPVGGAYFDVLLPGRRWLGHSEVALSSFGRRGVFPLAGGVGSYTWHGTKLDTRLGLRYLLFQQRSKPEWFVGSGLNFNTTLSYQSSERYGAGSSRLTASRVRVPTQAAFFGPLDFVFLPYVEAGMRCGRLTLSVDAAPTGTVSYTDPLAVYASDSRTPVGQETDYYAMYSYGATLFSYRAVLAFRLSR